MRFHLALAAAALLFLSEVGAQVYGDWAKYRTITINTTNANGGANVTQTVTNFPVLVRLTNQSLATGANVLSEAAANGADIRFTNEAGDVSLDYEIERWTSSGADIWVRVPSIEGNANTVIRVYWGNSAATSASSGPAVFDTTNGFVAVWHMNGQGSGGQVNEADATGGGLTATQFSTSETHAASSDEGGVGYFRILTATGDDAGQGFTTNNPARANFLNTQNYKVSAWVNPTSIDHNAFPTIVSKHDNLWSLRVNTNETGPWLFFYGNGGGWPEAQSSEHAVVGQWTHVAGVRSTSSPNAMSIYVNGVLVGNTNNPASGGDQPQNTSVAIGRRSEQPDRFWNGAISEVRLENVARSADWIKLEYETQKPGATALTFGTTVSTQPRTLFYPLKHATYMQNAAIESNLPIVSGGTATSFSINPTQLPAGLDFSTSTGEISGTPTAIGTAQEFIVTVNLQGGGSGADTISIAVVAGNPPGAPTSVTATPGVGQATVAWSAPTSSGSSPITEYTVRAVQDTSKTCTWTTGSLNCTVTGLTNGTEYTFTVVASNSVGAGPASSASAPAIPATTPGAPTNVTAAQVPTSGATASVSVSWTAPTETGGRPITGIFVIGNPGGTCFASAAQTSCTVTGLTYGTDYTFRAAATNAIGIGDTSAASSVVSPVGILPGAFVVQATGSAQPFTFVLSQEAIRSTEAFTMSINDIWGRTVWSRTVHPARDGVRELTWDSRNTSGQVVSSGMYVVRVSTLNGGAVSNYIQKAVKR